MKNNHSFMSRRLFFSSALKLYQNKWTEKKNKEVFSSCSNIHGYNFCLDCSVKGLIHEDTGLMYNIRDLDQILKKILKKLDHQYLNELDIFQNQVPSTENICLYLFHEIKKNLPKELKLAKLRLYQDENFWVDIL